MAADEAALELCAPFGRDVAGRERSEAGRDAVVRLGVAGQRVDRGAARGNRLLGVAGERNGRPVAGDGDDILQAERPDPDGHGLRVSHLRIRPHLRSRRVSAVLQLCEPRLPAAVEPII